MAGTHADNSEPIHTRATRPRGAHRADPPADDPANLEPIAVEPKTRHRHRGTPPPMGGRKISTFAVTAATGTMMLVQVGMPSEPAQVMAAHADSGLLEDYAITAADGITLAMDSPSVTTEPAPAPVVVSPPVTAITPVVLQPVAPPPAPAPVMLASAEAAPPPAPAAPPSSKGAQILASARAQLGWTQDCVAMTSRALASVGVSWYDWPIGALGLGYQVSAADALPGDILYYVNGGGGVAHVAVYAGNGQAVHGGYNGNQTVETSATVGYPVRFAPTAYIRIA